MSVHDIDREEWRDARDAAERDGDLTHPLDCTCRDCRADELTEDDYR